MVIGSAIPPSTYKVLGMISAGGRQGRALCKPPGQDTQTCMQE